MVQRLTGSRIRRTPTGEGKSRDGMEWKSEEAGGGGGPVLQKWVGFFFITRSILIIIR